MKFERKHLYWAIAFVAAYFLWRRYKNAKGNIAGASGSKSGFATSTTASRKATLPQADGGTQNNYLTLYRGIQAKASVMALQAFINANTGVNPKLVVDGAFGEKTEKALKLYYCKTQASISYVNSRQPTGCN